ncbi:hypothetical protein [Streptomyces aurantiogriseus]|uniref:Peptidase n=1 Tax=Streptomyces aurantiogriseus TaxID=66870 RepID=A0A918BVC8_9ACTN|nr:hypothetical protein [Streptomyces aurantiogriseus]GGQ92657.1 hypothetical protein GCM10010251_04150 [Streptomyces aurantiogriseus]
MGRRARWTAAWGVVRRVTVVAAVVCVTSAALPGTAAVAADMPSYGFDEDARSVTAAPGTGDAVRLEPGTTYRSSFTGRGKAYYRLELDAASNAYVSVTAVPRADATLASGDGIKVSVQDADSTGCSRDSVTVGASRSPRPLTAWGAREIQAGKRLCQEPGTYYVVVDRTGTGGAESDLPWELELALVSEPPLEKAGATSVPESWNSATPAPVAAEPVRRPGGAGFARATPLTQGVWRDDITPGQTLFYKVPVGWGQQLYATVDLDSAEKDTGFVVPALDLTLYNPVRAEVDETSIGYGGRQTSTSLPPLPPIRYVNRYAPTDPTKSLRFAGSHYLVVHLAAKVADRFGDGPYGLKLRIGVGGAAQSGPGYAAQSAPRGVFEADTEGTEGTEGGEVAAGGDTAGGRGGGTAMKAVAVGGIGTGTALLLVLGVWTVMARRRA